jgi:hypothetical protein
MDPGVADYTPVYLPNIEYRDHRGLKGEDLKAYNATKARLEHYIVIANKAVKDAQQYGLIGSVTPTTEALRKLGCTGCFLPSNNAPYAVGIQTALANAQAQLKALKNGTFPFATFKNVIDGQTWAKYYNEAQNIITVKVKPPSSSDGWGLGIDWIVDKITDAIVWVKDKIKDFIVDTLCPYLRKPSVQAVLTTTATIALKAGLIYVGVPSSIAKYIAGIAAAIGVKYLASQCGFELPSCIGPNCGDSGGSDSGGTPPQQGIGPMRPQPVVPKYPPGTISRYNTTHGVWMVYAPKKVLSGVGDTPATVPPVPDGFEKVAEEAGAPNSPPRDTSPQGQERDRGWFDNKLVLGGAALAAVGAVVFAVKRRKRSSGLRGLDGLTTKRRPDFQSQGGYEVFDDNGKKIVEIYRDMAFGTGSG